LVKAASPEDLLAAVATVDALRFEVWEQPPAGASRLDRSALADRVRGCIFGAALGDAAGLACEFLSAAQVADFYGPDADFAPGRDVFPDEHRMMWVPGDWTDDTDQSVLILQSLLECGGRASPVDFAARLLAWRAGGFPQLGDESAAGLGQATKAVLNDPSFATDPHAAAARHTAATPSNGGVMRTAVAGIPFFWDEDLVTESAESLCLTTHADPRCVASCVAVSVCVSRLLRGEDLGGEVEQAVVRPALERATSLLDAAAAAELETHAGSGLDALQLDETRRIGFTFKCLGAGLCALRSDRSFQQTLNELIRRGGDADTNGAVAGALLGCRLGCSRLPPSWIAGMPYASWLEAHAQKVLFMLGLR